MTPHPDDDAGRFVWVDLAAADADRATDFYCGMFGWRARNFTIDEGHIVQLSRGEVDIASLYQLDRNLLACGVPSHWTPYVEVDDADAAAARAAALGGRIVVPPFDVPGIARVGVVQDPVGALFGLWQPEAPDRRRRGGR